MMSTWKPAQPRARSKAPAAGRASQKRKKGWEDDHTDEAAAENNPPSAENNSQREMKKKKRVPFSDAECNYVLDGYNRFKEEKQTWVLILKEYPFNPTRTSVDLKDKHRNLMKKQN